jgi:8-oxo-dGTP pyrophosphatase MutT (NUDIX family)
MTPDANKNHLAPMRNPHVRTLVRKGEADERAGPNCFAEKRGKDTIYRDSSQRTNFSACLQQFGAMQPRPNLRKTVECLFLKGDMSSIWKPSVTVAAIIERDQRFLLVEEQTAEGIKLNQPAGHLDPGESLMVAAAREALEETAHEFIPDSLVGVYLSRYQSSRMNEDVTYVRFAFTGALGNAHQRPLDEGILRIVWMSHQEIRATQDRHRSPLVLQCVEDYLAGQRFPLSILYTHPSIHLPADD